MNPGESRSNQNKIRKFKDDYQIYFKKVNNLEESFTSRVNQDKFLAGELKGAEAKVAERDVIKGMYQETDRQGEVLKEILGDMRGAKGNMQEIAVGVNAQGEQLKRIQQDVVEVDEHATGADKGIVEMHKRNFRTKCCLWIIIFFLFVFAVTEVVYYFLG